MTGIPVSELARVSQRFPGWTVQQLEYGRGFTAHRRSREGHLDAVYAPELPALEARLAEKEPPPP